MKTLSLLIISIAAIAGVWYFQPPIPQDIAYHDFVDTREMYGIPNFWNIASNGLILLVGFAGAMKSSWLGDMHKHTDLRREFGILFTAAILTSLGSAWYHLAPSTSALVLDRLPMAIMFTALLSIVISIYISELIGKTLFWPLVAAGVISVLYWYRSEQLGAGDLRFYALTQYLSAALILIIIVMYRGLHRPTVLLAMTLIFYAVAKLAEHFDAMAYEYTGIISGHSIKHLSAGLALFMVYLILRRKHA